MSGGHRCQECNRSFRKAAFLYEHQKHVHRLKRKPRFVCPPPAWSDLSRRERIERNMRAANPIFDLTVLAAMAAFERGAWDGNRGTAGQSLSAPDVIEARRNDDGSFGTPAFP